MTSLNIIRSLTIQSKVEGAEKTQADLKGIQSAHEGVARVTETSSRGQLSLADAVAKAERRFNTSIRAQQDFERVQRQMNAAVAQNPALQERASAVIELARHRMIAATAANDNFARGTRAAFQTVQGEAQALAGRLGVLGGVLSALGPAGLVLAAFGGAAALGLHQAATAALALADRAGKLKDFAETTGFTVIELQALEKVGAQVGVSSESVTKALERFSVQMVDVRLRTGETYEKLLAIDPALARQVSTATSLAKAYELVATAVKRADLAQANEIAKAFFGRGGVEQTRLMRAVADADGLKGMIAGLHEADIITAKQAERWDTLGDKIAENMKAAKQNLASVFTEDMLVGMERFSKAFLEFSREVKQFGLTEDLKKFIDFFSNEAARGAIAGALAGGLVAGPGGALVGASVGAIAARKLQESDANAAAEAAKEAAEEWEKLNNARDRAINGIVKYQALAAANPEGPFNTEALKTATEYGFVLERVEKRIAALGIKNTEVKLPTMPPEIEVGVSKVTDAQEAARIATVASYNEMARWMAVIGAAATLAERYELATRKLNAAKARGQIDEEQYTRAITEQKEQLMLSLGVADQSIVVDQRVAQVREVAAKAGLSDEQTRLAVSIAQREASERYLQVQARAYPLLKQARDAAQAFGETLGSALLQGKSLSEGLIAATAQLAQSLLSSGIKDLISDNPEQMIIGAVKVAAAFVVNLLNSAQKAAEQERKRLEDLVKARRSEALLDQRLSGTGDSRTARLSQTIEDLQAVADQFWIARDATSARRVEARQQQAIRDTIADIRSSWSGMIDEIGRGNSVFSEAKANIAQFSGQLRGFIADTTYAGMSIIGAQKAAQDALLGKLQTSDELSEVATEMQRIAGTAEGLRTALAAVGMTAEQAALAIESGVTVALDRLRANSTAALQRELNDATGKSFLNDMTDLLKQVDQMRADNAALGTNADSLIDRILGARAQKVIDDTGLVGDAFQDLLTTFPNLTGVVHESTAALERQTEETKRLADEQSRLTTAGVRNILEYLTNLQTGAQSTNSPQVKFGAAQSTFESTNILARAGNVDALARWSQDAENFRLAAREMFASGQGYQDVFNRIMTEGLALPAVQATTDPLLQAMRDNLEAVLAGNLTLVDLKTAIDLGLNNGSITGVAAALQNNFTTLDTSVDGVIDKTEMKAALGDMADDTRLAAMFKTIDTDNSGTLDRLELIRIGTSSAADQLWLARLEINKGLNDGDASGVARALNSHFTMIDRDVNGLIDQAEMKAALGDMANDTRLQALFQTIDTDNSGSLDKMELIRVATHGTADNTWTSKLADQESVTQLIEAVGRLSSVISEQVGTNSVLAEIRALNATSAAQLNLLNSQLSAGGVSAITGSIIDRSVGRVVFGSVTVENNLLTALNKIVVNTKHIAENTSNRYLPVAAADLVQSGNVGQYAQGGTIPPFGLGLVSEHSSSGGRFLRAGAEPIHVTPFHPANDNSALLARIDKLTAEVTRLQQIVAKGGENAAQAIVESIGDVVEAVESGTQETTDAISMKRRDQRAA